MDYVIHARGLPFNGETVSKQSLGGSESAAYYIARELAARGHRVTVFSSSQEEGVWDGVTYVFHGNVTQVSPLGERFDFYAVNTPHDVLVVQRYPEAFAKRYASKVNVWQLHDLGLFRQAAAVAPNLWGIDLVTTVSAWQSQQVREVYGINPRVMRVVPNGVDPELYDKARHATTLCDAAKLAADVGFNEDKMTMLYQSRPERGLEHLLRPGGIMDRLAATGSPVHLFYCAYDFTHDGTRAYYEQLNRWGDALPNVTNLGALTKADLAEVQCNVDLLCYPTAFEEVSCITAMEAMHAHLPMLTSRHAALPETCEGSGTILLELKDGRVDEDAFFSQIETLVADLNDGEREEASILAKLAEAQRHAALTRTWVKAVDHLEGYVSMVMGQHSDASLVRHCIEHGDIGLLRHVRETGQLNTSNRIVESTLRELDQYYGFTASPEETREYYAAEQAKWVAEVESFITQQDNTEQSARYQGVRSLIAQERGKHPERKLRVLDFGAAYGHYLVNLGKTFPDIQFTGLETSKDVVRMGRSWINRENLQNVDLQVGDQQSLSKHKAEHYDVVLAGEIVEHVWDWEGLLRDLKRVLTPGGLLIVTTPWGRHEWNGPDFQRARQHLHHFERNDIVDICEGSEVQIMCAPSAFDACGKALSSWVWAVRPGPDFPRPVNRERKLAQLTPRQTVSLCMIVKDGGATVRKALGGLLKHVDEVIVGIDPVTTDNTASVLRDIAVSVAPKPFEVFTLRAPVLNTGFADARNQTLDRADGDWVLWMDADEEVHHPELMDRLLKVSTWDGYAMPQLHYAVEPPQVLTTDYPTRLFRRNSGARFHGLVHEHPEVEQGKAIPFTAIQGDVKFIHNGYVDEATRRRRFQRNYPLLVKDCELNPNRILNKFLMLRDISQSIHFEREVGLVHQEQINRAENGKRMFGELLATGPTRMVLDALQFYSVCVEVTGGGFDADVTLQSSHAYFKELSSTANIKGRFADRKTYLALLTRVSEEMTQHYESRYV